MPSTCFNCSAEIEASNFGRRDVCDKCHADTRVCKNCTHYDVKMNNHCRENQAPRIVEKEKSNFCDWFKPNDGGTGGNAPSKDSLKAAAESLFKKK